MWEPGTHIVCIKEARISSYHINHGVKPVVKGVVYTVRRHWISSFNKNPLVQVREIVNPVLPSRYTGRISEGGYPAHCFRPLKKLKIEDFLNAKAPEDKPRAILERTTTEADGSSGR